MRRSVGLVTALGLATLAAMPARAGFTGNIKPNCPDLNWSDAKTANPAPADMQTLKCWQNAGEPGAGYIMAMLTQAGRGTPADPVVARKLLLGLARGSADSTMETLTGGNFYTSYNVEPGGQLTYAPRAKPYPPAMRELAKMMLRGQGGDRDVSAAMGWLKKADAAKDPEAGVLYKALKSKGL